MRSAGAPIAGLESSSALVGWRALGLVAAMITTPTLARVLGPAEFGVYSTGLTIAALALALGPLGVDQLQLFHGLSARIALRFLLMIAALSAALVGFLAMLWPDLTFAARVCVLMLGVAGALRLLLVPWLVTPQQQLKFGTRGRREVTATALPSFAAICCAWFWSQATSAAVVNACIVAVTVLYAGWISSTDEEREGGSANDSKLSIVMAWPYAASTGTYALYWAAGGAVVAGFRSPFEVGQYRVIYLFAWAASVIPVALNNDVLRARLAKSRDSRGSRKAILVSLRPNVLIGVASATSLLLLGPMVTLFVYGEGFEQAARVTPVIGVALLPLFLHSWASNALVGLGRVRLVVTIQAVLCVTNAALNMWFVPRYGFEATAWVLVATEVLGVGLFSLMLLTSRSMRQFNEALG